MQRKLRVTYGVGDNDKTFLVMFSPGQTVGKFLELVKEKQHQDDLCAVYLDGALLDNGDMFDDWYRKETDAVFRVTNPPTDPPAPVARAPADASVGPGPGGKR
jgi:hypothetical protein